MWARAFTSSGKKSAWVETQELPHAFSLREITPPQPRFPLPVSHSRAPFRLRRCTAAVLAIAIFLGGVTTGFLIAP